jgi:Na+-driven multidrug efflux pump
MVINISTCYLISLPIAYHLSFMHDMDVQGLWLGMIGNVFVQALVSFLIVKLSDWDKITRKA